jgi:pimeloyl-ACP methyl ester carboxylesterase
MRHLIRAAALAVAVVLAAVLVPASPASARVDSRTRPIIFVHGLDPDWDFDASSNCANWNQLMTALRDWGHNAPMHTMKYYAQDTNCTDSMGSTDQNTSIWTLGYLLADWIWDHYTVRGIPVDIVGHSMGGLIARAALANTGAPGWPQYLLVEDVVTLGTPHQGSDSAYGCWYTQCEELRPNSAFLQSLPENPQGYGGTDWTLVGSDSDLHVQQSGVGMTAAHKVMYLYPDYGHSDYYTDTSPLEDADVHWNNGAGWYAWYSALRVGKWTDYALTFGTY